MRSEPDETATAVQLLRKASATTSREIPDGLGLEDPHAMRTLGRVLTSEATPAVRPPRYPRPPRPPRGRRIVAVAAPTAAAVAAGIALTVISLEGSTEALAAKFPVFASSTVTPVPAALLMFKAANVDATSARAIATPHGTAYASSSHSGKQVCLAAPGITVASLLYALRRERHRVNHIGYLGGCAPLARVEGRGLLLSVPTRTAGKVELVGILPAGASASTLHTVTGRTRKLGEEHGAIAAIVPTRAMLEYTVDGRRVVSRIPARNAEAYKLYAPNEH